MICKLNWLEAPLNTTVVLVGSNERAVAPIATALAGAGYAACVVFSYGEAQRRLQVSAPDALVVNVELGAHNGLQLAMQCSRCYPTTPVIVLGPASACLEHDALALGATAYMARPFTAGAVLDRLHTLAPVDRHSDGPPTLPDAHRTHGLHATA